MIAFLSLGGFEILLILFITLLLFGAKRLPELARSLGQAKREFTRVTSEVEDVVKKVGNEGGKV